MLTAEQKKRIRDEVAADATPRAALIEALKTVQARDGWLSDGDVADVAEEVGMTTAEVDAVATFYNTVYRRPVGRHVITICDSVSCWLNGYDSILEHLRDRLGIGLGETTPDEAFTLIPVACLGACDRAPAMMVDSVLYTRLDAEGIDEALKCYGWQPGRPEGGA